jgi:hypothetical protein
MAAAPHGRGFQLRRPYRFFLPKSRVDLTRPSPSMREGVSPDVDRWRYAPHALSGYGKAVAVEIAP